MQALVIILGILLSATVFALFVTVNRYKVQKKITDWLMQDVDHLKKSNKELQEQIKNGASSEPKSGYQGH